MPKDPYAVLHALLRAESVRERRSLRADDRTAGNGDREQRPEQQDGKQQHLKQHRD
ncbi:hypothetical protein [Streptomyces indicus]|uniref:Uncharacterized protein n=1 Tax=Streptomyces indicus TaxID=417292 RepID=A0A1G9JIS7_9ACTN|nr:hypothetical protein [Streptomyces indicus]SDL37398.1 hypothetical protein SAMN05421806_13133 [Streptomyces indicus]